MKNSFEIANLIAKKIKGTITNAEQSVLDNWIKESPKNLSLYNKAINTKAQLKKLKVYQSFNKEKSWGTIEKEIFGNKTIRLNTRRWMYYAAAILLPVLITTSVLIYFNKPENNSIANVDAIIKPGSQKAVLVLSGGESMELSENIAIEDLEEQSVNISKKENALIYSAKEGRRKKKELVFNVLKTPRGGGYNLVLADGTEVWLNAESNLRFPVEFIDSTRRVYLEGEAYFHVSHNGKPFIVTSENMDVRVLGTSFNVSAYTDEDNIKTTLVEGKVLVEVTGNNEQIIESRILTPNNQAIVNKSETIIKVAEVNTSQYTSWIHGKLEFNNENLDMVMKSLARWYNFEYEFVNASAKDYHFSARLDNSESISTILEMLEMTTDVKFEMKEKTIVIL